MSIMHAEWRDRLKHWQRTLKDDLYVPLGAFSWEAFRTMEHLSPQEAQAGNFEPVQTGYTWAGPGNTAGCVPPSPFLRKRKADGS